MREKKVWYKHPVTIGVGVLVGLGIIGNIVGPSETSTGGGGGVAASKPMSTTQAAPEDDNIVTVEYGPKKKKVKAALLDETAHLIARVERRNAIGNEFMSTHADGQFLILRMQVHNGSNSTRTISTSGMVVIDEQGREFAQSAEGQTALAMSGDQTAEFLMSQIQPGLTKNISVVFDVPPEAKDLKLRITGGGLFSGETAVLAVRNP